MIYFIKNKGLYLKIHCANNMNNNQDNKLLIIFTKLYKKLIYFKMLLLKLKVINPDITEETIKKDKKFMRYISNNPISVTQSDIDLLIRTKNFYTKVLTLLSL